MVNRIVVAFVCWITWQLLILGLRDVLKETGFRGKVFICESSGTGAINRITVPLSVFLPPDPRLMERCGVPR